MENTQKHKSKFGVFILIFRIISIIIIGVCLYVLYEWHLDNKANNSLQDDLSELVVVDISKNATENTDLPTINARYNNIKDENNLSITDFNVNFDELNKMNSDSVAWVRIPGTNISYPVVQGKDNDYYLTRNIKKEKNGAGWIYADYRNIFDTLDKNTIIYGHNRRNGTMFSNLKYYLDKEYCSDETHKYINFNTKNKKYIAEIFSVYKITSTSVTLPVQFSNDEEFMQTINNWKSSSIYDFQKDVSKDDNILTLYTCDNNTTYRILIHAKLVPIE